MTNRGPERGEPDLDDLLRALAQDDARTHAPEHLRARVMAAWDGEAASASTSRPELRRRFGEAGRRAGANDLRWWNSRLLPHAAGLAAAVVLMVAWLVARGAPAPYETSHTTIPISEATNLMTSPAPEAEVLQLVRVRMPRGALRAFGIALVDPDAAAEVEVDVIVGEDGFPRSIRRVQPVKGLPAISRQVP